MTKESRLTMATVRTDQKQRALMRAVPESFSTALAKYFGSGPTDIALAKKQHAAYAQALLDCGLEVTILPADENHPDCIFVEDQAIVVDGHVLLPLPGHPSRVAEQPPIADFLSRQLNGFQVCGMFGEARMDGGDLLRLGNLFFVARSKRTNDAGIEIYHLPTAALVGRIKYTSSVDEIFDLKIFPGMIRPNILNTINSNHKMGLSIPESSYWAKEK